MDLIINHLSETLVTVLVLLYAINELWISTKRKSIAEATLNKYQSLYQVIEELENNINASRVVLLRGHNSGEPLNGFNKMYSSVIASTTKADKWRDIAERWKGVKVDSNYIETIKPIFRGDLIRLNTDELKEKTVLRDLYEHENFKCSYVILIGMKTNRKLFNLLLKRPQMVEFVYLSCNFDRNIIDGADTRNNIRTAKNKLSVLYKMK